jgi:hypothetical protein
VKKMGSSSKEKKRESEEEREKWIVRCLEEL